MMLVPEARPQARAQVSCAVLSLECGRALVSNQNVAHASMPNKPPMHHQRSAGHIDPTPWCFVTSSQTPQLPPNPSG